MGRVGQKNGGFDPRNVPVYGASQASHHLGIPLPTLRSWVAGRAYPAADGLRWSQPVIKPAQAAPLLLSFTNMVELHVLSLFRTHDVQLRQIREAIEWLEQQFGAQPLARHDFLTDGLDIFAEIVRSVIVNANRPNNRAIPEIAEQLFQRIDRDEAGIAKTLYPSKRDSEGASTWRVVQIDPRISFGRPVLSGTRIPTEVLAERYRAGEKLAKIAEDYQQPWRHIKAAITWEINEKAA